MSRSATTPEYEESFIERLEMMWGRGYLSPGGAEEVRTILAGEDFSGKKVLDIGCGAGGAEVLLIRELNAADVVGIDIVPELVERARRLCNEAGLDRRVELKTVEPGPLPFRNAVFDVVFTKDALLHIPDKAGIFREIHRVLRPGGLFVGSDWLAGENIDRCPSWACFLELRRPSFVMANAPAMAEAMRVAKFERIELTDRNTWLQEVAAHDVSRVEGPLRDGLRRLLGEAGYDELGRGAARDCGGGFFGRAEADAYQGIQDASRAMNGDADLCYLTVTEAVDLFSRGALSPRELMEAVVRRIDAVDPAINALGDRFLDEARDAAAAAERRWLDGTARPLEGIPLAVKDAQQVAGQRTTYGSPAYRDNIARQSDPMIERLSAAGAIIHARTTASEFCVSGVCTSPMWGTTRNPWNTRYSPGGSSGGSAAALAAGMTPLATGTDMGGSIRVPASACGVVGYKPPHGRIPEGEPFNVDRVNHCGVLARSVRDVALVQNIISGRHPRDHDSLRDVVVLPLTPESVGGMRVAWSPDLSYRAVDPEVHANLEEALAVITDLGCTVEKVDLGWTEDIDRIAGGWYRAGHMGRIIAEAYLNTPGLLSPDMARLAAMPPEHFAPAQVFDLTSAMSRSFTEAMRGHDLFVCPTMTIAAVRADQSMWDSEFKIAGRKVDPEFGYATTHHFNLLSNCPAISVPAGRVSFGVPAGLQIVGRPYDDETVFRLALAFEAARGPWFSSSDTRPSTEAINRVAWVE